MNTPQTPPPKMARPGLPLAVDDSAYTSGRMERPQADPLGQRGLPAARRELDLLADSLCRRLPAAGSDGIPGRILCRLLDVPDTRALRLLVAYARVHLHVHQIVGRPGSGYVWGDVDSTGGIYRRAVADNRRRGRCHFFIAALHSRQGPAMEAVQLVFDFMEHEVPADQRHNDDLSALLAATGTDIADFLDAFVTRLAATDKGQKILADAGQKHADILLPAETLTAVAADLEAARQKLLAAARRTA